MAFVRNITPVATGVTKDILPSLIDAVVLVLLDQVHGYLNGMDMYYKNVTARLKEYEEPVFYIVLGFVGIELGKKQKYLEYLDIAFTIGIVKLVNVFLKTPFAIATDASTIEVKNLDASKPVSLYIDGSSVNINVTTDSSGNATIKLSTAMSSGKHNILVHTGFKAWFGTVVV